MATATMALTLGGLTLRGAPLGRSTPTASLGLSRVGSEGSDLSGYVVGADLQPHQLQPHPGSGAGDDNNVVVVQLECPRCQRIDSRCVFNLACLFSVV